MELIITLLTACLFAWIGSEMAKRRNRDPLAWGIICVIFGLFGIIVLALVGTHEE
jgi:hypothetical protein